MSLSLPTIRMLKMLEREAFDRLDGLGLIDVAGATKTERFTAWAHEQQKLACGKASLKDCGNRDVKPLRSHFLMLAGRSGQAFDVALAGEQATVDVEQLRHKIAEAQAEYGFADEYVAAVVRGKFKGTPRDRLSAGQLVALLSTLNNRGRSKIEREANGRAYSGLRDRRQASGEYRRRKAAAEAQQGPCGISADRQQSAGCHTSVTTG